MDNCCLHIRGIQRVPSVDTSCIILIILITDESEFGQKPPSLIDYIKGTLSNYPDGSQILKV